MRTSDDETPGVPLALFGGLLSAAGIYAAAALLAAVAWVALR